MRQAASTKAPRCATLGNPQYLIQLPVQQYNAHLLILSIIYAIERRPSEFHAKKCYNPAIAPCVGCNMWVGGNAPIVRMQTSCQIIDTHYAGAMRTGSHIVCPLDVDWRARRRYTPRCHHDRRCRCSKATCPDVRGDTVTGGA
jgi:hypothetical protein